jgi:hypothetical protein
MGGGTDRVITFPKVLKGLALMQRVCLDLRLMTAASGRLWPTAAVVPGPCAGAESIMTMPRNSLLLLRAALVPLCPALWAAPRHPQLPNRPLRR